MVRFVDFDLLARRFRALSDPTRVQILYFLNSRCQQNNQVRVSEIAEYITGSSAPSSRISFHLKELKAAGLVIVVRSGKYHLCQPCPESADDLLKFLQGREEKRAAIMLPECDSVANAV